MLLAVTAMAQAGFKNTAMGEMEDEDGVSLGFTSFKAADGSALTVLYHDFDNREAAHHYFETRIQKAEKLVERKQKVGTSGNIVGERAEVLVHAQYGSMPAVLWTDGFKFHEIYSSSRKSILKLEKVYQY